MFSINRVINPYNSSNNREITLLMFSENLPILKIKSL